jgi:CubicO group peptidase (beta-lactamase class C family)
VGSSGNRRIYLDGLQTHPSMKVPNTRQNSAIGCVTFVATILLCGFLGSRACAYEYTAPDKTTDGWATALLSDEKLEVGPVKEMFDRIEDNTYKNITSVVIVRNGKLVVEEYFPRQEVLGERGNRALKRVSPQQLYSATKSVTSILIGIAVERGLIRDVEEKVSILLPEYADLFADKQRAGIRLKDLLAMSAGMAWNEWTYPYSDARNDALQALLSPDPVRYILARPMVAAPGEKFAYNTGISLVLGEIIRKASGLPVDKFAERYLFTPLGITDYYWAKIPGEMVETGGGLFLRPRDMAKLGYLFLNGGRWKGTQIVAEEWIRESTRNRAVSMHLPEWVEAADGYGYQWWLGSLKAGDEDLRYYGARGRAGQFILVFPSLRLVAVFTGLNDNILMNQPLDMLRRYILPKHERHGQKPEPGGAANAASPNR